VTEFRNAAKYLFVHSHRWERHTLLGMAAALISVVVKRKSNDRAGTQLSWKRSIPGRIGAFLQKKNAFSTKQSSSSTKKAKD
jgi:hypothetical protein